MSSKNGSLEPKVIPYDFSTSEPILLIVHENDLFWYITAIFNMKFWKKHPAFSVLRAISSELLKINRIEFRKSEKILPREWSKGVILKILAIYLENWAL